MSAPTSAPQPRTGTLRSSGRVVGSARAAWLRVEGHWTWYRRYWHSTLFSSVIQPLLFLVAMGVGFGAQVRPGAATGGLEYLVFLAPAVLVAGATQTAVAECSYPVLSGFKWQKDYIAVVATPITAGQLLAGQQLWLVLRLALSGLAYLAVAATFVGPGVFPALPVAVLTGTACGTAVMAMAAILRSEGQAFNALFRFVMLPMILFSGTFFPVSGLPGFVQPVVWATPLWHGNELSRALALGGEFALGLPELLLHLGYLLLWLVVGTWFARIRFYRRLVA